MKIETTACDVCGVTKPRDPIKRVTLSLQVEGELLEPEKHEGDLCRRCMKRLGKFVLRGFSKSEPQTAGSA